MKQKVFTQELPGGTNVEIPLETGYMHLQLEFIGRATGVVTVTAKGAGGDVYGTVTNGAVDLNTHRTLVIRNTELAGITLSDAGTGAFSVRIKQYLEA